MRFDAVYAGRGDILRVHGNLSTPYFIDLPFVYAMQAKRVGTEHKMPGEFLTNGNCFRIHAEEVLALYPDPVHCGAVIAVAESRERMNRIMFETVCDCRRRNRGESGR